MTPKQLKITDPPPEKLRGATMLLALSGWMDGGDVSTGTVKQLLHDCPNVRELAHIASEEFYIFNFPGSMEVAALFRPEVEYDEGVVKSFEMPENTFSLAADQNLVFFIGKEPNLRWQTFADCIYSLAKSVGVSRIIFIGSFGGSVPHTRQPRLYGSVSHPKLRPLLKQYGIKPSEYEGPAGLSTLLLADAPKHKIEMISFVAEIPGYLQGTNPLSIEAITRRLGKILNLPIDLAALREASDTWENEVTAEVEKNEELATTIRKLEEEYDNELIKAEGG